ncbi:MAG: hypothetical protein RMK15_02020 [Chloroflexota bacterium]|nr:hypothetical protein [Dehalococcoidia bacterium]MDW8046042.1 hypothetical protein [Chloroflexota bacterium]
MRRPLVSFDLDGVLARPPFGINPGTNRGKRRDAPGRWNPLWPFERWRYAGRRPMPGAREALMAARSHGEVIVVSARGEAARSSTERWLRRHFGWVPPIFLRPSWRERSAQFKVRVLSELRPCVHVEDDPHTAEWLAEILPHVVLVDWRRNRWLRRPNIHRVASLTEVPALLERLVSQDGCDSPILRA